ncbi:hypothetical protein B0A48_07264 [Cryoendolithus antarcticus]|uniref:Mitochondrial distribution and morphology protein 31 n=1 Tax=Cryoendolithus antarcticus TaxID=1507870 RepID=A0A1V8T831_9PEZI|nr:hypothetical protein B0A48_07264 [Cryoendolithus antarcticus]
MSRHVTSVGRRHTSSLLTAPPRASPLVHRAPILKATLVGLHTSPARAIAWRRSYTEYASTANTTALPTQVRALTGLGLRAGRPLSQTTGRGSPSLIAVLSQRRWKSEQSPQKSAKDLNEAESADATSASSQIKTAAATVGAGGKHLYDRLPHLPHLHRPTKEELLSAATGFWHRLGIRFKWFSIRSIRPFTFDEFFAFASWLLWAHIVWIILGTTTFVSLAILTINTVFAQETLAAWVGNYLTKSSGLKVVFESAIVPKWNDGVITFSNVFVSRRPGKKQRTSVSKGSSTAAAAEAAMLSTTEREREEAAAAEEDSNYTQFDVTIDRVNVTLSFTKWFNGKGLLRDVEVHGVRGVIDRTSVHSTGEYIDPKTYRHEHNIGDFEIDGFKMSDVLLTMYQPNRFRPFTVSVFACELPRLRKQWLFYDFLSANTMSGSFDDSLFTIHPVQSHGRTDGSLGDPTIWKKQSRLRIDGLAIDHLNRGVDGPFSWIYEGNVDIVADITIPHDTDDSITAALSEIYDRVEASVQKVQTPFHREDEDSSASSTHDLTLPHASIAPPANAAVEVDTTPYLILDIRTHLNSVRASVPLLPSAADPSLTTSTLIRPIIAYINTHSSFIPIHCRVIKPVTDFNGSWTVFDSGLLEDLSREVYGAFERDLGDQGRMGRRVRKVGLWGLGVLGRVVFGGLAGVGM